MFEDFIDDLRYNIGWVLMIVLVLAGFAALIYFVAKSDRQRDAHKAQVCVEAMQMARTSADSIAVKLRCDLPEPETGSTVIPMPIIIPSR